MLGLGFSIAHFYCFPVEEWEDGYRPTEDQSKFGDVENPGRVQPGRFGPS